MLGGLALGLTQVETGLSEADQFLDKPEAISAGERLAESFPAGFSDPTVVMTRDDARWCRTTIDSVEGVGLHQSGPAGDGVAQIDAVLSGDPGSVEAKAPFSGSAMRSRTSRHVRRRDRGHQIDDAAGATRDQLLIIPLVLAFVVVALVLLLRSLVAPVILVGDRGRDVLRQPRRVLVVFTHCSGSRRSTSGVPLLAFLFLVALGVDYNIFLVTRAAEEARRHGPRRGHAARPRQRPGA